jgi:FixJ family two-component response regulator
VTLVFVVDGEAEGMVADLSSLAKQERLDFQFEAYLSPQALFQALNDHTPEFILLHHNWSGIGVSQVLGQIEAQTNGATRVVVFTGQTVKINELIECVRCGVADYWTKNTYDAKTALTQISYYCASQVWTIKKLKMSSGSLRKLLDRAEGSTRQVSDLEQTNSGLRAKIQALESKERSRLLGFLVGIAKMVMIGIILVGAFVAVDRYTRLDTWANLSLVAIIALCFLLSEGRITSAWVRWAGGSAGVRGRPGDPDAH